LSTSNSSTSMSASHSGQLAIRLLGASHPHDGSAIGSVDVPESGGRRDRDKSSDYSDFMRKSAIQANVADGVLRYG
jgi:hypothetical protein